MQILGAQEEPLSKKVAGQFFEANPEDPTCNSDSSEESTEQIFLAIEEQNMDEDQALSFISNWDKDKKKRTWSENKALNLARKKDRRTSKVRAIAPDDLTTGRSFRLKN